MPRDQIIMGCIAAAVSAVGLFSAGWFVGKTRKGAWLRERYGERKAKTIVRVVCLAGIAFGILLAANVLRPMQW